MVKGWDPLSLEPTNAEVQAMQDDSLEWEEIVLTHSNVDLPPFQKTIVQGWVKTAVTTAQLNMITSELLREDG